METNPKAQELRIDLTARLRRIEGQVRGVQRMLDEDRDCTEILQQMSAIRSAVHQSSLVLARAYIVRQLHESQEEDADVVLDRLMTALWKLD